MISPKIEYVSSYTGSLRNEIKELSRIAIPIFIGQLSSSLLGVIDTVMSSSLGVTDLSAISLGCTFWIPLSLLCIGIPLGLSPIIAHLLGKNNTADIPKYVYNAMFPILIIVFISILLLIFAPSVLLGLQTKLSAEVTHKATNYLYFIAAALPAMSMYHLLRNTSEGLMVAWPTMFIGLMSLVLNVPLNYVFMYGKFGLPAMGAVGCGVATAIVSWISLLVIFLYCKYNRELKEYKLLQRREQLDFKVISYIFRIGFPVSIALLIENFTYHIFGYATGFFGNTIVAAHQIANVVTILVAMLPVAVSTAEAVRISNYLAIGSRTKATISIKGALIIAHCSIIPVGLLVFFNRYEIIGVFTDNKELISLASPLFTAILIFQMQDALFGTALGIVRGFKDTKSMMIINFVILWCFGAPAGYFAGFTDFFGKPYGLYGLWGVLVVCYCCITLAFCIRSLYLFSKYNLTIYRH